jgi:hypothetical protein
MSDSSSETPVLELLASMTAASVAASSLNEQALMLVRIAAVDAPVVSYAMNLEAAGNVGLDAEAIRGVLAAIAPIIGMPRVTSAIGKIVDTRPRRGALRSPARSLRSRSTG